MAAAAASDSCPFRIAEPRSLFTIRLTADFEALPVPVTADFTACGLIWSTGIPICSLASSAIAITEAVEMHDEMLRLKKTLSIDTRGAVFCQQFSDCLVVVIKAVAKRGMRNGADHAGVSQTITCRGTPHCCPACVSDAGVYA